MSRRQLLARGGLAAIALAGVGAQSASAAEAGLAQSQLQTAQGLVAALALRPELGIDGGRAGEYADALSKYMASTPTAREPLTQLFDRLAAEKLVTGQAKADLKALQSAYETAPDTSLRSKAGGRSALVFDAVVSARSYFGNAHYPAPDLLV